MAYKVVNLNQPARKMKLKNLASRENVDLIVCVAHILAVLVLYNVDPSFVDKIVGRLLLVMEITTILFL